MFTIFFWSLVSTTTCFFPFTFTYPFSCNHHHDLQTHIYNKVNTLLETSKNELQHKINNQNRVSTNIKAIHNTQRYIKDRILSKLFHSKSNLSIWRNIVLGIVWLVLSLPQSLIINQGKSFCFKGVCTICADTCNSQVKQKIKDIVEHACRI